MKPHIVKINGLWYCVTQTTRYGIGYKPSDAYAEWVSRNKGQAC